MSCFFKLLFPGVDYSQPSEGQTIWIDEELPCIFYPNSDGGINKSRLLIYFHGNAEDASIAGDFIRSFMTCLDAHAVVVEYPTYGVYKRCKNLTEERIFSDSERAYEYFKRELNLDPKQIIICGRSIGSGASSHLASKKDSLGFILISPLAAVDIIVLDKIKLFLQLTWLFWAILTIIFMGLGFFHSWNWLTFYGMILLAIAVLFMVIYCSLRKFRNIDKISSVRQPTLIIHGKDDEVIPYYHSQDLLYKSGATFKEIQLFDRMTHNQIEPFDHLEQPIGKFFEFHLKKPKFPPINIKNFLVDKNQ
jgi:pimeloyl-ACP methyl ester carboxylesterase